MPGVVAATLLSASTAPWIPPGIDGSPASGVSWERASRASVEALEVEMQAMDRVVPLASDGVDAIIGYIAKVKYGYADVKF